jgi:hypothetical protein
MGINLRDNILKCDESIIQLNNEIKDLESQIKLKKNDILRLEGSKLVYIGLTDVFGDNISVNKIEPRYQPSSTTENTPKEISSTTENTPKEISSTTEHSHIHSHDHKSNNCDKNESSEIQPTKEEELSIEDLYMKYRAM